MGKSAAAGHGQDQRESVVVKEYGSGSPGRWGPLGNNLHHCFHECDIFLLNSELFSKSHTLWWVLWIVAQTMADRGRPTGPIDNLTIVNKLAVVAIRIICDPGHQI